MDVGEVHAPLLPPRGDQVTADKAQQAVTLPLGFCCCAPASDTKDERAAIEGKPSATARRLMPDDRSFDFILHSP